MTYDPLRDDPNRVPHPEYQRFDDAKEPGQVLYECHEHGRDWSDLHPDARASWNTRAKNYISAAGVDRLRHEKNLESIRADMAKQALDAVANALHPHWQGDGHTYVPEQLPGMVDRLRDTILQIAVALHPEGGESQTYVEATLPLRVSEIVRHARLLTAQVDALKADSDERLREAKSIADAIMNIVGVEGTEAYELPGIVQKTRDALEEWKARATKAEDELRGTVRTLDVVSADRAACKARIAELEKVVEAARQHEPHCLSTSLRHAIDVLDAAPIQQAVDDITRALDQRAWAEREGELQRQFAREQAAEHRTWSDERAAEHARRTEDQIARCEAAAERRHGELLEALRTAPTQGGRLAEFEKVVEAARAYSTGAEGSFVQLMRAVAELDAARKQDSGEPAGNGPSNLARQVPPAGSSSLPNRWRTGRTSGRTLYRDGESVGRCDTRETAEEVVCGMNELEELRAIVARRKR